MPTWQTSTGYGGVSERGVDGNTGGGDWYTDTCTHTDESMYGVLYPTWGVQLSGDGFWVHYITITNRRDYRRKYSKQIKLTIVLHSIQLHIPIVRFYDVYLISN